MTLTHKILNSKPVLWLLRKWYKGKRIKFIKPYDRNTWKVQGSEFILVDLYPVACFYMFTFRLQDHYGNQTSGACSYFDFTEPSLLTKLIFKASQHHG